MVTTSHQILFEYVSNMIRTRHLSFTSMDTEFTHNTLYGWGWGIVFSSSLVTIPEATTLTQLPLLFITRQFLPSILVRVWKFEVLRQSLSSLGWVMAHLTTLRWRIILSTSSIDSECMFKTHPKVAAWSTSKSSSQASPSGSWTISSKSSRSRPSGIQWSTSLPYSDIVLKRDQTSALEALVEMLFPVLDASTLMII